MVIAQDCGDLLIVARFQENGALILKLKNPGSFTSPPRLRGGEVSRRSRDGEGVLAGC
jgi:hypothetical protein